MVLGEQALHTNAGGTEVMTGQLEHLLAVLQVSRPPALIHQLPSPASIKARDRHG
jgi:hypothetical protein